MENVVEHVAIIMDGNGRWAKEHNYPRSYGHKNGMEKVREIAICASELGIKYLTLYTFSTENWKRPEKEINYIFSLPKPFFKKYIDELMANNIKVTTIGDLNKIPEEAKQVFKDTIKKTSKNTGLVLNFALNYGGRDEIVKACKKFAKDYKAGLVSNLNEESFKKYLMTKDFPDVDLLIRTSPDIRISNFLLYQIAYSEMIFINKYWPAFTSDDFKKCIDDFAKRNRRFGGLNEDKNN